MSEVNRRANTRRVPRPGLRALALLAAVALLIAACGTPEDAEPAADGEDVVADDDQGDDETEDGPSQGGVLRVSVTANPSTLDPMAGNIGSDHQILYPLYDTFVDMDPETGEELPMLATDWEFEDPQTLVMELRDDVTFHDGEPFDAEAAAYNLDRAKNHPDTNVAADVESIESVDVLDDHTIEISLNQPDAGLPLKLADRAGMVVSPAADEEHGDDIGRNPVGTGPHQFVEWRDGEVVTFERYDDYWQDDLPYLDGIEMVPHEDRQVGINALLAGEVDLIHDFPPPMVESLEEDEDLVVDISPSLYVNLIFINKAIEPFDDPLVRQALNYAIDKEEVLQGAYSGIGDVAHTILPEDHWAYPDDFEPYTHDPDRARELLEEAGHGDGISFEMATLPAEDQVRRAEIIQAQLAEVGMDISIESAPVAEITSRFNEEDEFPITNSAWTGRPAPQLTYDLVFRPEGYFNAGDVEVPGLTEHLDAADAGQTVEEQAEVLGQAANVVAEQGAFVPVHIRAQLVAFTQDVKGFESNQIGKLRTDHIYMGQ